jgi:hypothetical protein
MTQLRMMLEELERRNYAQTTIGWYIPDERGFRASLPAPSRPARCGAHPRVPSVSVPREKAYLPAWQLENSSRERTK